MTHPSTYASLSLFSWSPYIYNPCRASLGRASVLGLQRAPLRALLLVVVNASRREERLKVGGVHLAQGGDPQRVGVLAGGAKYLLNLPGEVVGYFGLLGD